MKHIKNTMSRAIASARQRRAGIAVEPPAPPTPAHPNPQSGLTLPQVISLVDARLIKLEKFMTESQQKKDNQQPQQQQQQLQQPSAFTAEIVEEFQTRFDILAQELSNLKDVVLKLQAYTMEVNKALLEERGNSQVIADANTFTFQGFQQDAEQSTFGLDTVELSPLEMEE